MNQCQCNKKSLTKLTVTKVENGFLIEEFNDVTSSSYSRGKIYIAKNPADLTSVINQLVSENQGVKSE